MRRAFWMFCLLPALAGCDFDRRIPADEVSINQSQPMEKVDHLSAAIQYDIGSLEITQEQKAAVLYSLDLAYDKNSFNPDIRYSVDKSAGRFDFNLNSLHKTGIRREGPRNKLRMAFTGEIPLDLNITTGVGDTRLSLSGMKLSRLDFESGVGAAKISAYEPNAVPCEYIRMKSGVGSLEAVGLANLNFRNLEFEGGVGGASLDFTGEWRQNADIDVQVGVGGVDLRLPREIGVKVEAEKHFLSGLQLEGFTQRDDAHYSQNYNDAKIRITVHVTTGIGGLKITWL